MSDLKQSVAFCNAEENSPQDAEFAWGAKSIGKVINKTERQTHNMLALGSIKCARKIKGGGWVAHRKTLRKEFGAA